MSQFTWAIKSKRHQGTYKVVPNVDWEILLVRDFGHPNWAALYPLNNKGQPVGVLTPRMACKLFHDAVHIVKEGEKNSKFVQDRIPEIAHKCYKKKQWRKQFFEAMRRVCCRLALGKGFRPNCVAEDVFIHSVLSMSFELGWRRINQFIEPLPESEADKDFSRVTRLSANEEIGSLNKVTEGAEGDAKKAKAAAKATSAAQSAAIANAKLDVKSWFQCYELTEDHLFDHIVTVTEEESDNWSVNTGSASEASAPSANSTPYGSLGVDVTIGKNFGTPSGSPRGVARVRSNSQEIDMLTRGIGVKNYKPPTKDRSNSVISALSDHDHDHNDDAAVAEVEHNLDSLQFNVEGASLVN